MPSSKYLSSLILAAYAAVACAQTPDELVQSFQLTQTASLPIPTATATNQDTQTYLTSNWGLARARIQEGADKLSFVNDPYPDKPVPGGQNVSGPVLQAFYPSGSFSHDTGGAQFTSLFNSTSEPFLTMMVSYEVAFEEGFEFVKGGKLPGLRGGTPTGCSGGSAADGKRCFSARLMWRKNALGEAYVYMPTPHSICNRASFDCNDDFGISISRGAITFTPGEWQRITILARLNNPPNVANGDLRVYWNDAVKISQQGLQFRSADNLTANGFFFSTFFGGADDSWATPKDIHTYYRNIRMWGSTLPSNLTGEVVPDSSAGKYSSSLWATAVVGGFVLSSLFI